MSDKKIKIAVVIPTRNRADLAKNAILSVLGQNESVFDLIVSDNSTEEAESETLKNFCDSLNNPQLFYIRPPRPLSMTKHWNWAMEQAVKLSKFTHIVYLTDRALFKHSALTDLIEVVKENSKSVIIYGFDNIDDTATIKLYQMTGTENINKLESDQILKEIGKLNLIQPLPKMLNCIVPRYILDKICLKYGEYFSSIAPDYNFAYSCLSVTDEVIHYDKSLVVFYATSQSNGMNLHKGIINKYSNDFIKNLKNTELSFKTPLPTLFSMTNVVFHEYCYMKLSEGNCKDAAFDQGKYIDFDHNKYLHLLSDDIISLKSNKLKYSFLLHLYKKIGIRYLKCHLSTIIKIIRRKLILRTKIKVFVGKLLSHDKKPILPYEIKHFLTIDEALYYIGSGSVNRK